MLQKYVFLFHGLLSYVAGTHPLVASSDRLMEVKFLRLSMCIMVFTLPSHPSATLSANIVFVWKSFSLECQRHVPSSFTFQVLRNSVLL